MFYDRINTLHKVADDNHRYFNIEISFRICCSLQLDFKVLKMDRHELVPYTSKREKQ